ncbi:elongation factor P hydroxylase [Gallaecimonas kandeliae]|uniref:elongation factor P hydroxylase n=1 Tax=Gallaecimonas kandeliae TaxID=3029055 RepID=UPI002649A57D|nr:elongation factor P hydroxylase [Gallaecimonas kandeliae]WKE64169.1 elongation factor P hydroxylase [Gallaecimonas kandeliae]
MHQYPDLISLFNATFLASHNTELVRGDDEPIYLPADGEHPHHRVVFAHGYYASALHEIAHWCLAGDQRRELVDYGYWYCPDGRDNAQQKAFEEVEVKPQAIEWGLCAAAGFRFNVSTDNLNGSAEPDRQGFQQKVHAQVLAYLEHGFPPRAARFMEVLAEFYGRGPVTAADFGWEQAA